MLYFDFKGTPVSRLGFGAMRMPVIDGNAGNIDETAVQALIDRALERGINYFDTAYSYHLAASEGALGRALARHPRESYLLADKFPGHEIRSRYDCAAIFQEQIDRTGADYFDFYLMHNVTELSLDNYLSSRWNMVPAALGEMAAGRIRHLGFSTHGTLDTIKRYLDKWGEHMEFCQLEVNYLDWTLQGIREKYEYITSLGIPVWIMEPVRGGKLAALSEANHERLQALRPGTTDAEWAFRWVQDLPNNGVVLSGMNTLDMIDENCATFSAYAPLSPEERAAIDAVADSMLNIIPCTGCRYCTKECPVELDIPLLLSFASEAHAGINYNVRMGVDALDASKRPDRCLGCGACAAACPQGIDIPGELAELVTSVNKLKPWAEERKYD